MDEKNLQGALIYLQELDESFFSDYISAFSFRVREILHVKYATSELEYLRQRLEKQKKDETVFFCIFDNDTEKLIGALEIRNQSETGSQLYSWLHEDFWGSGRYQEALRIASQEYFRRTSEQLFYANVDANNKRSYYALKKNGFSDIGTCSGPYGRQYQLVLRKR